MTRAAALSMVFFRRRALFSLGTVRPEADALADQVAYKAQSSGCRSGGYRQQRLFEHVPTVSALLLGAKRRPF